MKYQKGTSNVAADDGIIREEGTVLRFSDYLQSSTDRENTYCSPNMLAVNIVALVSFTGKSNVDKRSLNAILTQDS
jgi:hypothetical protein